MNRRKILSLSAAGVAGVALAGCTVASSGGVSSITIDVAKIDSVGSAVIAALTSTLAAPSVAALLGSNATLAKLALVDASALLKSIDAAAGGAATLSVNTASVQGFVASLLADINKVLGFVVAVAPSLTGSAATVVGNYVAAVEALLPLIALAAALAGAKASAAPVMTEETALYIATH